MKILLSWIDLHTDMEMDEKTGEYSGPTVETVRLEEFDRLYVLANSKVMFSKATLLKRHVSENRRKFKVKEVFPKFLNISNPTDHKELWEKVPLEIEKILKENSKSKPKVFINLSAGTPAMRTTWMMMIGSGEIKATALNVQRIDPTQKTTIDKVDVGIYPFISKIKQKVDEQLRIPGKFSSDKMQNIMRRLASITGDLRIPILLLGETGTGKTTIASMYHRMTGAPEEKLHHFVCGEFNVGDLNTIKSQLFGHVKGAYTGAENDQAGVLMKADGGTVFLDEIGDIPLNVQRLLINAVEKKEFRMLGSSDLIQSDFRLICATNRNIKNMLKSNELSQDFYNRIRSCEFEIPPLRERVEDISDILRSLLAEERNYKHLSFSDSAYKNLEGKLKQLSLPGNIRDIQRILDHLAIQSNQPSLHSISTNEIEKYFDELSEPSQTDEFIELTQRLIKIWPETVYAYKNYKWQEALTEIALKKMIRDSQFKKKNGDLNINKISSSLGIDNKTIKSRLKQIQSE
jgi:DNA-binding NtrC family response regulator